MKGQATAQKPVACVTDIEDIRRRAQQHMEHGAVTEGHRADRTTVIDVLSQALTTELMFVLRYKRHHHMASEIQAQAIAEEFLEHAQEEQEHADMIAERIAQLDGAPDFNPAGMLTGNHSEQVEGTTLEAMLKEDLVAEQIAIEAYAEVIRFLGENDPTSRQMMEEILAKEEEHADDMKTLLETVKGLKLAS